MANNDASKLSIPLLIALSAVVPLVGVGISYGVQTSQISALQADVSAIQSKQEEINRMAVQLARVEAKVDMMLDMQKRKVEVAKTP